ncbi:YbjN domain-containing protein [Chlorobium phaeovibrioides]|uniref:YbjN domain-containing protein n=1 Tax=Chlorobium phaeovibrioides TaxID=1094 RepID=A0A5M8I8H2_CHLPH|nr:YbjN domain-containing protein [Chlorobium phaeovibrioides]KAA6231743.1 hypothetical protein FP507_00430 [Chlorobium phaeovibrioides]MWV55089.1 hypothetical protein [Chlorobium phaeovibrioides]QEQ57693.1 hypothetical protein FNV82_09360 [Chlorobium phaeovibrioides]
MRTIEFSDINKENLAKAFELAAFECEIDDENNEIYIKSSSVDFPLWVKIDNERKTIKLYTYLQLKEDAPHERLAAFAQKLNNTFVTVKFTTTEYDDGRAYLNGNYFFYTTFGIIVPQLIHTIKMFSEIFIDAIREHDEDNTFFA